MVLPRCKIKHLRNLLSLRYQHRDFEEGDKMRTKETPLIRNYG